MQYLKDIADKGMTRIRSSRHDTGQDFRVTRSLLEQFGNIMKKSYDADTTILTQDAISHFAIGMETVKNTAFLHPAGGMNYIDDQADRLKQEITTRYGDLGDAFTLSANKIITNQKIKLLNNENRALPAITMKNAKKSYSFLTMNTNSMGEGAAEDGFKSLHNAVQTQFGDSTASMMDYNARSISKLRQNVTHDQTYILKDQPPVIEHQDQFTAMNASTVTSDLLRLQTDNPMLGRGFLRIHGIDSASAEELADRLQTAYPDSPEPAAIRVANGIREKAIRQNALEYGSKQLYYNLNDGATHVFTGMTDHRMEAASDALHLFGTTNFFTEQNRQILKTAPTQFKVVAFAKQQAILDAYNAKHDISLQINPKFLDNELKKIDPYIFTWTKVINALPELINVNPDEVRTVVRNRHATGDAEKIAIPDVLLRVDGIGDFLEQANTGNELIGHTNKVPNVEDFFTVVDNYAYLKRYQYGSFFTASAKRALNSDSNIVLKNIGVDMYRVYTPAGTPLILNGSTVDYSAEFLEGIHNKGLLTIQRNKQKANANDTSDVRKKVTVEDMTHVHYLF